MKLYYLQRIKLLLLMVLVCALPHYLGAQTEQIQDASSNGAGIVSGGNYTGYASAGQIATYMYANGNGIATQGIILNEISANVEFTFELTGNLNENPEQNAGQLIMKSSAAELAGTPLASAWVYLILAIDSTVYDSTQTDVNGFFIFENVPYRNFFFMVNSKEITEETPPLALSFEENPVFVKEVEINGEVGTGGIDANVELTPQLTTGGDQQEYTIWYRDADGDGFGNPNLTVKLNLNAQQSGYVSNNLDCNDQDITINPDIEDTPGSGVDANCDGIYTWYIDDDDDGFGSEIPVESLYDYPVTGQSENNLDCDDDNPFINPDALDVPGSGIDANCDGVVIECTPISEVIIAATAVPIELGQEVYVEADYQGDLPHSATWDWGDENISNAEISEGLLSGTHFYDSAGVFVITLTITDNCELTTVHQFKYLVIYDPEGGFVTGSGTVFSPEGASTIFPNATGFASFGFVSKYDKKKGIPKGNTEFQFDAGDLDFVSNEYEWLIVAGARAKFKGRGSINGETGYQFMISAIDGDLREKGSPDLFRIKIWEETSEDVVYDNEMGVTIDQDPTTQISEGAIVVHVPKIDKKSITAETEDLIISEELNVRAYPNPTFGRVSLDIHSENYDFIEVVVTNISGQEILRKEAQQTRLVELDLSGNTAGMYYIRTQIGQNVNISKIVLQHK